VTAKAGGFLRNNTFLVAAVSLPVLVVIFFLLATAIPRWTVPPPAYDLILRVGKPYEQTRPQLTVQFSVRDGQLEAVVRPVQKDVYEQPWSLFRFDHETMNLEEIPFKVPDNLPADSQPQTIVVDALAGHRILAQAKAPDGYELRTDKRRGGPGLVGDLFGMHNYDQNAVLVNKGRVVSIPLPSGYQYLSPVTAIGWLTDAR
jgi:hypothetical protein